MSCLNEVPRSICAAQRPLDQSVQVPFNDPGFAVLFQLLLRPTGNTTSAASTGIGDRKDMNGASTQRTGERTASPANADQDLSELDPERHL